MARNLNPSEHDKIVRTEALRLISQGYDVRARIEGWFEPPDIISGYRPDIVARKDNQYLIVEIEKGEIDWPKIAALQQFASTHQGYELIVVPSEQDQTRKTGT